MPVVYFDASRLFLRAGRSSPTGIDRVVFAYARWLRGLPGVEVTPVWSRMGYLSRLPARRFNDTVEAVAARGQDATADNSQTWDTLLAALRRPETHASGLRPRREAKALVSEIQGYASAALSAVASPAALRLERGAMFINVNHFGLEHPLLLKRIAEAGVRPAVLIHDLIPVNFPEFCSPGGAGAHGRRIENTLRHADRIITNSRSTADELTRFAAERGLPPPACVIAPLGLERTFLEPGPDPLTTAPYFVCVGTLEPRKNLSFLLSLWRRLPERLGSGAPRLVLIGRRGWENESIVDQLERSPVVLTHVHEVSDLGDRQVASLIHGAVALLSPSFTEGFNLPVMEALSLGTPVIASDIPVHRELAAEARLIDPLDGPAWLDAICAATVASPPRGRFRAPTWEDHFEIVAAALELS